jgi:hypothetical protein
MVIDKSPTEKGENERHTKPPLDIKIHDHTLINAMVEERLELCDVSENSFIGNVQIKRNG